MTAPDVGVACVVFFVGALVSLSASAVLVVNIERVAARLGLAEAILGLIAAIAADGPEISSATAALIRGQHSIGAGVVFGSNVFNLAALLGLSALIAGRIALHRSVVLFGGAMALWAAGVSVIAMAGAVTAPIALVLVLVVFIPYVVVSALSARRLGRFRLPRAWVRWLSHAVLDEETELRPALHPSRGSWRNAAAAGAALAVVIVASVGMEQSAATLGSQARVSDLAIGALLLAAVTSLPNAVAAIYLATRHRGLAAMSEAFHSNAFNVIIGLLIPAVLTGVVVSGGGFLVATWYLALTVAAVVLALVGRGLGRLGGIVIVGGYVAFVVTVIAL